MVSAARCPRLLPAIARLAEPVGALELGGQGGRARPRGGSGESGQGKARTRCGGAGTPQGPGHSSS